MFDAVKQLSAIGIVPVVAINDAKDAVPMAKALINGGLPCAEITFRTAAAKDAIAAISQNCPEMIVGAGTVLTPEQADDAVLAGAKFIVSPGLNPEVVRHCLSKGYPIVPGICTPGEIETAITLGLDTVKFFPAEAAGGIAMIKAMSAPYTNMKFMPTGGINAKNLRSYLDFDRIVAAGGSWMVNSAMIAEGRFDEIESLTREAVQTMLGFELDHIGFNCSSVDDADLLAGRLSGIFGMKKSETPVSFFAGRGFETMKAPGMGDKGHIAVSTNYLTRAVRYLESQGVAFDQDSKMYNESGSLKLIYLSDDFGGFRIHLVQKAR